MKVKFSKIQINTITSLRKDEEKIKIKKFIHDHLPNAPTPA